MGVVFLASKCLIFLCRTIYSLSWTIYLVILYWTEYICRIEIFNAWFGCVCLWIRHNICHCLYVFNTNECFLPIYQYDLFSFNNKCPQLCSFLVLLFQLINFTKTKNLLPTSQMENVKPDSGINFRNNTNIDLIICYAIFWERYQNSVICLHKRMLHFSVSFFCQDAG